MAKYIIKRDDSLQHFGIKGQKWGVRRYENEDGTLTEAGKKRYAKAEKIAEREKISKEQMAKNAAKRAAVGATAGAAIGSIADSILRKKAFLDSTTEGTGFKKHADVMKEENGYDFLDGFTYEDMQNKTVGNFVSGFHTDPIFGRTDDYTWYYPNVKFKNNGAAYHLMKKLTKNLLSAPAAGAAIGAGATALGSLAVDKIHNARIDKAKKFVERYTSSYQKTISVEKARQQQVKAYKDAHPNSTLNDKEIEMMLRSSANWR